MIGACLSSPGIPMSHLQFYPEFQELNIISYENCYFLVSQFLCHDICPERGNKFFQNIGNSYPFPNKARRKERFRRSDGRYILGEEGQKMCRFKFPRECPIVLLVELRFKNGKPLGSGHFYEQMKEFGQRLYYLRQKIIYWRWEGYIRGKFLFNIVRAILR